jgi:carbamoyl-phosphate synthase small subunit
MPQAFSVQYHPEAAPGPRDTEYLFEEFVRIMEKERRNDSRVGKIGA